jgi:hypothetical protein
MIGNRVLVLVLPFLAFGLLVSSPAYAGNIYVDPALDSLSIGEPSVTLDVEYSGGGSGPIYGYQITVAWNPGIVTLTDASEGSLLPDASCPPSYSSFFDTSRTPNSCTIYNTLLGDCPGTSDPGTMFTLEFEAYPSVDYGVSSVDLTIDHIRDCNNQTLMGFFEDDGELAVDVVSPEISNVHLANLTLSHTDDFIKDGDDAELTANVSDGDPNFGIGHISADLTALGGGSQETPDSYVGTLATWSISDVSCNPSDGFLTVTASAQDPFGNDGDENDQITADNTPPASLSGFTALPHSSVNLSWNDPASSDPYYEGVVVRRTGWMDYPEYTSAGPGFPGDPGDGDLVYEGDETSFDDPVSGLYMVSRGVYFYQGFAYDTARNYSSADPGARDSSTNYFLGDFADLDPVNPPDYDAAINAADLAVFSNCFVTTPSHPAWEPECDVGPTDDHSRFGVPAPDDSVNFEDLMILALNYYNVPAPVPGFMLPIEREVSGDPSLTLEMPEHTGPPGSSFDIKIMGQDLARSVKGIRTVIDYDPAVVRFMGAREGEVLDESPCPSRRMVFFHVHERKNGVEVNLAIIGEGTICADGEVGVLTFQVVNPAPVSMMLHSECRDEANRSLLSIDGNAGTTFELNGPPLSLALRDANPNPFATRTEISFSIPNRGRVSLDVFDASGRLVKTLWNGEKEAGTHVLSWYGEDETGRRGKNGVYFFRLSIGPRVLTRKAILVKY